MQHRLHTASLIEPGAHVGQVKASLFGSYHIEPVTDT